MIISISSALGEQESRSTVITWRMPAIWVHAQHNCNIHTNNTNFQYVFKRTQWDWSANLLSGEILSCFSSGDWFASPPWLYLFPFCSERGNMNNEYLSIFIRSLRILLLNLLQKGSVISPTCKGASQVIIIEKSNTTVDYSQLLVYKYTKVACYSSVSACLDVWF